MKLSNALTAMSLILLITQTMQQPAFATDPSAPGNGTHPGSGTTTGSGTTSLNTPEGNGSNPAVPYSGGNPYAAYGTQPGTPYGSYGTYTFPGNQPFNVQLGYQSLVLMDYCVTAGAEGDNSCLLKAN